VTYYVGDSPSEDLVVEPARNDEPMDLAAFDSCTVTLRDEAGTEVESAGFLATIEGDTVIVEWPGGELFADAGLYTLTLVLESDAGARERVAPVYIVIQGDDGWLTLDAAREDWPDARKISDRLLHILLSLSKSEVLSYGDPVPDGERPPLNYVKAQGDQARNKLNASKVDPASGGFGDESFIIKPFPLDWAIKQTIRPKTALPVFG